jgi:hypothetical protein
MHIEEEARCSRGLLCDFFVLADHADALVEECSQCHRKAIYRKDKDGRVDNRRYGREHQRDFLQPFGESRELYRRIYGHAHLKERDAYLAKKRSKLTSKEVREIMEDVMMAYKRKHFS